jgi:hypothetical protein
MCGWSRGHDSFEARLLIDGETGDHLWALAVLCIEGA